MTKGEQMAKILADTLSGCPLLDPCSKIWASEGWCKDHCKPGQQEPDAECWLKYAEVMVKEAKHSTDSSLTQKELDIPDTNVGDIYMCSCGYGWDKSKVFRHHFCPNCGRAVEPSYNTKTELNGDMISRQAAIEAVEKESQVDGAYGYMDTKSIVDLLNDLPSAQPEPSTEIQEILNYLDTTLHPIVSPDNWYVYAELHDMVSRLPSAQRNLQPTCNQLATNLQPTCNRCHKQKSGN